MINLKDTFTQERVAKVRSACNSQSDIRLPMHKKKERCYNDYG